MSGSEGSAARDAMTLTDRLAAFDHGLLIVPNPVLVKHAQERAEHLQNRVADRITTFAGSMNFVYLHVALFAVWMILLEQKPWPTLTLVVSLEAIFLSTFVMISQNRADEKHQVIAGQAWATVQEEDKQNQELIDLSRQILELTKQVHALETERSGGGAGSTQA